MRNGTPGRYAEHALWDVKVRHLGIGVEVVWHVCGLAYVRRVLGSVILMIMLYAALAERFCRFRHSAAD